MVWIFCVDNYEIICGIKSGLCGDVIVFFSGFKNPIEKF